MRKKESNWRQINKYARALWHFLCVAVRVSQLTASERKFTLITLSFSRGNKYIIRYWLRKMLFWAYGHLWLMRNTIWENSTHLGFLLLSFSVVWFLFFVFFTLSHSKPESGSTISLLYETLRSTALKKMLGFIKYTSMAAGLDLSNECRFPQRSDLFWASAPHPPFTKPFPQLHPHLSNSTAAANQQSFHPLSAPASHLNEPFPSGNMKHTHAYTLVLTFSLCLSLSLSHSFHFYSTNQVKWKYELWLIRESRGPVTETIRPILWFTPRGEKSLH